MKKIFLSILGLSIALMAYNRGTYQGNKNGCAKGNAKSCNDLAGMYLIGNDRYKVEKDEKKAKLYYAKSRELYSKYCDEGDGKACFELAEIYNGMKWKIKQDFTMMLKFHIKSCENNYARGCNEAGALYKRGRGAKEDKIKSDAYYAKAITLYEEECDRGIALSCSNLSLIYELKMYGTNNKARGLELEKKAFQLYEDLCDEKDDVGCLQIAGYYYSGIIVPVDWKKAKEYYEKSCKYGQDSACWRARDINISKQFEYEKNIALRKLWGKYAAMEEKESKAREARRARQRKEINDPNKSTQERKALIKKIEAENIILYKKELKRMEAMKKAYEDEKKAIKARTN